VLVERLERVERVDRQSRAVTHRKPSSLKLATSSSDADQNEAEEDSVASAIVTRCVLASKRAPAASAVRSMMIMDLDPK
jgi:hypothetical protein